jgi:hypothetical protein
MRNLAAIGVLVAGLLLARHNGAVLVAALVIAWLLAKPTRPRTAAAAGRGRRRVAGRGARRVAVRTPGGHGTKLAAWHEAGHRRMAKANGWRVESTHIFPDGSGVTWIHIPDDAPVEQLVAVDVAGGIAASTWSGCSSDMAHLRKDLARLPGGWLFDGPVRDKAKRAGYALARKTVGSGWLFDNAAVKRDAAELLEKGRING